MRAAATPFHFHAFAFFADAAAIIDYFCRLLLSFHFAIFALLMPCHSLIILRCHYCHAAAITPPPPFSRLILFSLRH